MPLNISLLLFRLKAQQVRLGALLRHRIQDVTADRPQSLSVGAWAGAHGNDLG